MEKLNNCPDEKILSSFFDGELIPDALVREHIDNCEKCRQTLSYYNQIKNSIKNNVIIVPDGLAEKLIQKVRQKISPDNKYFLLDEEIEYLSAAGINQTELPPDIKKS